MRIVLLVHQSADMYGSDKVLLLLVRELQSHGEFFPIVVLPEKGPLHDALANIGVEVHIAEVGKISRSVMSPDGVFRLVGRIVKGVWDLDRIVGKRKVVAVHSNTLAVLSGAVWAKFRRIKHLWHVHEIIVSPRIASRMFPALVRRLSDTVISNSTATNEWLLSEEPSLESRTKIIFNGLPEQSHHSQDAVLSFRTGVGAGAADLIVTLAGRVNRLKGHMVLIKAAAELARRGGLVGVRFVLIGSPLPGQEDLLSQMKAQVKERGLEAWFHFLPFAEDLWPVWFGTDIAVVPSTEPESFGMVAIEAMHAGVPVIASKHGGLLDIVVHNETGLLVTPSDSTELADALELLFSDRSLRCNLGAAGAVRQRKLFTIEQQVGSLTCAYRSMLALSEE